MAINKKIYIGKILFDLYVDYVQDAQYGGVVEEDLCNTIQDIVSLHKISHFERTDNYLIIQDPDLHKAIQKAMTKKYGELVQITDLKVSMPFCQQTHTRELTIRDGDCLHRVPLCVTILYQPLQENISELDHHVTKLVDQIWNPTRLLETPFYLDCILYQSTDIQQLSNVIILSSTVSFLPDHTSQICTKIYDDRVSEYKVNTLIMLPMFTAAFGIIPAIRWYRLWASQYRQHRKAVINSRGRSICVNSGRLTCQFWLTYAGLFLVARLFHWSSVAKVFGYLAFGGLAFFL